MRAYDYNKKWQQLLIPEIVTMFSTIHDSYEFIPVRPSIILQLHRDLYKFSGKSIGGAYKNADNVIAEEDNEGNRFVRFQPVPT